MLGLVLTDPVFALSLTDNRATHTEGGGNVRNKYLNAARVVENLICTSRESLIGSSAWRGEFFDELCSRPFYTVLEVCSEYGCEIFICGNIWIDM
jgi:hypothetical protein